MAVYLKSNGCNGRQKLGGFVFEKLITCTGMSLWFSYEKEIWSMFTCRGMSLWSYEKEIWSTYMYSTAQIKSKFYYSSFTSHEMSVSSLKTSVLSRKTKESSHENYLSINFGIC